MKVALDFSLLLCHMSERNCSWNEQKWVGHAFVSRLWFAIG